MSGGSYDYAEGRLIDIADAIEHRARGSGVQRRALRLGFAKLLRSCAEAMHELEWADSGDTDFERDAVPVLAKLLSPRWEIEAAIEEARSVRDELAILIVQSENTP